MTDVSDADLAVIGRVAEELLSYTGRNTTSVSGKLAARAPLADLRDRSTLDLLLDETIHFDRAMQTIADRQLNKATETVVEAVIYSLRSGTKALSREDVRERLGRVDEKQLREICARVQRFKNGIAKVWTDEEVERLPRWQTKMKGPAGTKRRAFYNKCDDVCDVHQPGEVNA